MNDGKPQVAPALDVGTRSVVGGGSLAAAAGVKKYRLQQYPKHMADIKYNLIQPSDNETIKLIANWYLGEWNIPIQKTIAKTKSLSVDNFEFQVIMTLDNKPIATGGLYNHVGLLDHEPRFRIYRNWLALVYTKPDSRGKGLGELICKHIQDHAKNLGLTEIYLFTHTAENLYKRLAWQQMERLAIGGKDIVIMKKEL